MKNGLAAKARETATRMTTINRVYVIVGLLIAIIICLILLAQAQMNALTAIHAFVGGESLWASAQKTGVR